MLLFFSCTVIDDFVSLIFGFFYSALGQKYFSDSVCSLSPMSLEHITVKIFQISVKQGFFYWYIDIYTRVYILRYSSTTFHIGLAEGKTTITFQTYFHTCIE